MPRRYFLILALVLTLLPAAANAQSAQSSSIRVSAGFSSQSTTVQARGEHNMADSATLRAQGCEGFVSQAPAVTVSYDAKARDGALVVRAGGTDGLVLLIGTATGQWHCAASGKNIDRPEIKLPPGSGDFSVWVGTRKKSDQGQTATLTIVEKPATPRETGCGGAKARIPESISASEWKNYQCMSESDAGDAWASCQPRSTYSDAAADGCPGAQRCCPAEPIAASQPSQAEATENKQALSPADDDDDPFAAYARPPVGNVAAGAPQQLSVETTPYGKPKQTLVVHWRGFPEIRFPVRATTTDDGEILFHVEGSDFPQEVTDSLLIVTKPRVLRAKRNVELARKTGALKVSQGQTLDLLGQVSSKKCAVRMQNETHTVTCPALADFEDTAGLFHGWSPLHYRWWIAVEDADNQRGWLYIDQERPEFFVEFKVAPVE